MVDFDMVIAECPRCGRWCFSWSEEDAVGKYKSHRCLRTVTTEELDEMIDRCLRGQP